MSIQPNIQTAKDFLAAIGSGDKQALQALSTEDIEWIVPGRDWPLAGTYRGLEGLAEPGREASECRVAKLREYVDTQALARASST